MKKLLCIINQPPYQNTHVGEQLDAAMVAAAFDLEVTVLFTGAGLWCLQPNQQGALSNDRDLSKVIHALPMYEMNQIYVCKDAAEIHPGQLLTEIGLDERCQIVQINFAEQNELLARHDIILGGS